MPNAFHGRRACFSLLSAPAGESHAVRVQRGSLAGGRPLAYAAGDARLFAVDNGTASGLFLFTSSAADVAVSAAELTLVGVATSTAATALGDYLFAA